MATQSRASYSHYELPDKPPRVALTDDDKAILLEVYRHDIIDAKTIYRLLEHRSTDKIGRRLNTLRKARYLERLSQIEQIHVKGGGALPKVYTIGTEGMEYLQDELGLPPKKKRLRERASRLSVSYVEHSLEQSRFLVSMRKSVDPRSDVHFLYPEDFYSLFAKKILDRPTLPFGLRAKVNWLGYREVQGTNPDALFVLYFPMQPEARQRRCLFLEIDRGTETINPSDRQIKSVKFWEKSSLLRKFVVYAYAYHRKVHEVEFGLPTFQVLTVTTKPGRVVEMQEMFRQRLAISPHDVNPNRFLFMDWKTLQAHGDDLVSAPVENAVGEGKSLLV